MNVTGIAANIIVGDIEDQIHADPPAASEAYSCRNITLIASEVGDGLMIVAGVVAIVFSVFLLQASGPSTLSVGVLLGGIVILLQSAKALGITLCYQQLLPLNQEVARLTRLNNELTHSIEGLRQENETFALNNTNYTQLNQQQATQIGTLAANNAEYTLRNQELAAKIAEQKALLAQFHAELSQFIDTNDKINATAQNMAATEEGFEAVLLGLQKGTEILKDWGSSLGTQVDNLSNLQLKFDGSLGNLLGLQKQAEQLQKREEAFAIEMQHQEIALLDRQKKATEALEILEQNFAQLHRKKGAVSIQLLIEAKVAKKLRDLTQYFKAHPQLTYQQAIEGFSNKV